MAAEKPIPFIATNDREAQPLKTLGHCWTAVHEKAGQIAAMADLAPEPMDTVTSRLDQALAVSGTHSYGAALRGLEDVDMLVTMGLTALREVKARGRDANAPALALWREFYHAREAVLTVLEPAAA
ncbi:hypothetical protein [uncultured Erythrobacter sp.]|uniref:hypothetical protein n=1 Tax=uncultured Erythrobacter sp. TaxID=263913 RepID=UPI002607CFEF|nr:hypothetical protein [uncultured Erythrobacter sp.]